MPAMEAIQTVERLPSMRQGQEGLAALALVREELALVEQKMRSLGDVGFAPLAEAFLKILESGGKRLRPAVTILSARFYPCPLEPLISLAAAVETLHTATLVHDDVIDNALLRRGTPTLNASWSHGTTILAGDYLFARAASFAAEAANVRLMHIFARTLMIIVDGELRQLFSLRNWQQPREEYYRRIFAKTASLFSAACESGAVLSGAPEPHVQALKDYGYHLGMAFQIMDDILDFTGDDAALGKPVGNDLRQGTLTLPAFYYLQAHPEAAASLEAELRSGDGGVERVVALIRNSPAIERAHEEARHFADQAKASLMPLPDNPYRQAMASLADFAVAREK
jgi:geranylgeranyl pyrophosphate synthase